MKKILIILLLLLGYATACRTKKLDVEKIKSRQENEFIRKMDSLFSERIKRFQEFTERQRTQALTLSLESTRDNEGNLKDFEYIHEKDGKVVESVKVKGAVIKGSVANNEHLQTNSQVLETDRSTSIKTKVHQKTISETTSKSKSKKVRSFGFSFAIYVMIAGALLFGFGIYKMRKQWKLM
ncbi:hypothetical protein ACI75Y_07205 [Capnocytophaga stomatis]|uniref:hypothetical protein n=1 Tax=Capnocytophaga stomatis TaxID=1848904 RepID=UPI00385B838E